jgi:hypothetical protein
MVKEIKFSIALPGQELKRYYEGSARLIVVKDYTGKTIQFSVDLLRDFVTREGVYGEFSMRVDSNNKFIELKKLT